MLIIGAKGFAKEVLEILHQNGQTENLCFYDDVNDVELPGLSSFALGWGFMKDLG